MADLSTQPAGTTQTNTQGQDNPNTQPVPSKSETPLNGMEKDFYRQDADLSHLLEMVEKLKNKKLLPTYTAPNRTFKYTGICAPNDHFDPKSLDREQRDLVKKWWSSEVFINCDERSIKLIDSYGGYLHLFDEPLLYVSHHVDTGGSMGASTGYTNTTAYQPLMPLPELDEIIDQHCGPEKTSKE